MSETIAINGDWKKYFDDTSKSYYWYNEVTNESKWDEEEVSDIREHLDDNADEESMRILDVDNYNINDANVSNSDWDIACYTRMLWFNAIVIENPIAVVEGFVRAICFFAIGLFGMILGIACLKYQIASFSCCLLTESAVSFAAAVTCLVPLAGPCMIYSRHHPLDRWKMQPLLTFLGKVDARRFLAFSFGGGASASNLMVTEKNCQDSLGSRNIVFFPRSLLLKLHDIQYGQNKFGADEILDNEAIQRI